MWLKILNQKYTNIFRSFDKSSKNMGLISHLNIHIVQNNNFFIGTIIRAVIRCLFIYDI